MKKIGIMYGTYKSFCLALIERINSKKQNVKASSVNIAAPSIIEKIPYDLIYDRVSHVVPMFASFLKLAKMNNIRIINDPFLLSMDDNLMISAFAKKNKIKFPKTVLLPSKEIPEGISADYLTNLAYPMKWNEIFDYIGFPAYLKPNSGHNNNIMYKIYNENEFFSTYDLTGKNAMILQEYIPYDEYFRVFTIGKKITYIVRYSPTKPLHLRYTNSITKVAPKLQKEMEKIALLIANNFDLDINTVEFCIKEGELFMTDAINPAPKAEKEFLCKEDFEFLVENTANFLINEVNSLKD